MYTNIRVYFDPLRPKLQFGHPFEGGYPFCKTKIPVFKKENKCVQTWGQGYEQGTYNVVVQLHTTL